MNKEGFTVHNTHSLRQVTERLSTERTWFLGRVEQVVGQLIPFATSVSSAIGEISTQEAIDGVVQFFAEEMRKVK